MMQRDLLVCTLGSPRDRHLDDKIEEIIEGRVTSKHIDFVENLR